jgi:hypothetical protein
VRSEQASIGARVRVGECGLYPEYLALDVLMEDGSSSLFWHYELEEAPQQWIGLGEITAADGSGGS